MTKALCLLLAPACLLAADFSSAERRLLNNEGLVVLARAGYNERFLTELIRSQPSRFDTSVEGLVYLAKQGISERMVRVVLAEQQRQEQQRLADLSAEDESVPALPSTGPGKTMAAPPLKPVRLKMVKQKLLVPEKASPQLGRHPLIVVEPRLWGDRYYALPATAEPARATPLAGPQVIPAGARWRIE